MEEVTHDSDLSREDRRFCIVTTAALPWMTGTSVNPLLRALYLARGRRKGSVTLMVPWLEDQESRKNLYHQAFEGGMDEQREWILEYCRNRALCPVEADLLEIAFWRGIYHHSFGSIFPAEDICALIPDDEADVAILEEPEHLNWMRVPAGSNSDDELGWSHKFKHVIGILHTNYGSYMRQYGMGTSIIAAPALDALSKLVIRAYCHRVIRLSATLPSFVPLKEVTCNVHGVRSEFFQSQKASPLQLNSQQPTKKIAAVYFIGKLIWAKGFEMVLRLQERYRSTNEKGEYFAMDIYGTGNDDEAIKRAFLGRSGQPALKENGIDEELSSELFDRDESLRSILRDEKNDSNVTEQTGSQQLHSLSEDAAESAQMCGPLQTNYEEQGEIARGCSPLNIIADLSKRTLGTGVETAGAAMQLVESALKRGFGGFGKQASKTKDLGLGPPIAAYKWRRTPIPARFLGRKDHIEVKDLSHSIFLNMSTSEVLCTTSAEALAMGKFVILPKHPSNEFFVQFSNCLAYTDLEDCLEKLRFAFSNKPEPLSEEEERKLSWKGAVERLYQSGAISNKEAKELDKARADDTKAARFHVETARKSTYVTGLFGDSGQAPKKQN